MCHSLSFLPSLLPSLLPLSLLPLSPPPPPSLLPLLSLLPLSLPSLPLLTMFYVSISQAVEVLAPRGHRAAGVGSKAGVQSGTNMEAFTEDLVRVFLYQIQVHICIYHTCLPIVLLLFYFRQQTKPTGKK